MIRPGFEQPSWSVHVLDEPSDLRHKVLQRHAGRIVRGDSSRSGRELPNGEAIRSVGWHPLLHSEAVWGEKKSSPSWWEYH